MSAPHFHTRDSACLEPAPVIPNNLESGPLIDVEGWYRCKDRDHGGALADQWGRYYVHDHGTQFVSHYPDDRKAGCPS